MLENNLNRRSFMAGLTALMGASLATTACKGAVDFHSGPKEKALTVSQLKIVELMADIIIPDTDTPGAAKADVHGYINHMTAKFMNETKRNTFIDWLGGFDKKAGGFLSLTPKEQVSAVAMADKNLKKDRLYRQFKGLVVTGYYTSEIGASQELRYDPVPGPYHEIPFSDVGRVWA